jgi:hypothetical protein
MNDVILVSVALNLFMGLVGLFAARYALKYLDQVSSFDFSKWLNTADDTALGIYFGCRILGVAIVIGFALS